MDMKRVLLIFGFALSMAVALAQEGRKCEWTPEQLSPGATVTITYQPGQGLFKNLNDVKGVYYCWRDYQWEAFDMQLSKEQNTMKASFRLPENTALVVWKFYDRDTVDVGGNEWTYASYVLKDGRSMPSANIGWAMLRGEKTQDIGGIPTVQKAPFRKLDNSVVAYWINNELRDHPEQFPDVTWFATKAMAGDEGTDKDALKKNLWQVLEMDKKTPLTENQLLRGYNACETLWDSVLIKAFGDRLRERYPKGEFAREQAITKLHRNS